MPPLHIRLRRSRPVAFALPRLVLLVVLAVLTFLGKMSEGHAAGLLLPTDGSIGPLAIRSHRVTVAVHERIAETRVVQVFRNNTDRQLEGTYIFPLPTGATVSGFAMMVNGVRQEGQVVEAAEARRIYEGIVARLQDPGLVEYMGSNLFRARVFPIPARGDQTVELRFTQTLDYQSSTLHYRYPLRTTGPQAATLEDFTLSATIDSRVPIRAVYSPSHRIDTVRHGDHQATVGFEEGRASLDRDFDLFYTVADGDVGLSVLTHHPAGEDGYFLMMVAPRSEVTEREIIGKDILFVCDTSGSMAGEKMDNARQALRAWIERLNPDDTFNILRFSTDVEQLSETSLSASADNRARAQRFVNTFEASGGTAIAPALTQALAIPVRRGAPRIVVFLTDGMPTVGETDVQRIITGVRERNGSTAQIFAFGLGDDVNTTFLDLLAQQNRGAADYARSGAEMTTLLGSFYNMIAFPVLADLRLALRGADAYDIYPRDLGTLYRGSQLVVTGRYRTPGATNVALTATVAGQADPRTFEWPVTLPQRDENNGFIPRVWATRKTGYLLDEIRLRGENPELRESVIQLARRFGIVTPYTSYLVTENQNQVTQNGTEDERSPREEALRQNEIRLQTRLSNVPVAGLRRPAPTTPAAPPRVMPSQPRDRGVDDLMGRLGGSRAPARPSSAPPMEAPAAAMPMGDSAAAPDFSAFQSLGGGGPGGTGSGSSAGPAATHHGNIAAPAPVIAQGAPPPPPRPAVEATGEAGRRVASTLRAMREAQTANTGAGNTRFIAGRSMVLRDGIWIEEGITGTPRELHIRALSRSYFTLVRLRPELREVLAIGREVRFRLDAGRVIVVGASQTDTADSEIEAFLR
ncbi:MAG: VIT domain-containing protein [Polyangiales bacterium]